MWVLYFKHQNENKEQTFLPSGKIQTKTLLT